MATVDRTLAQVVDVRDGQVRVRRDGQSQPDAVYYTAIGAIPAVGDIVLLLAVGSGWYCLGGVGTTNPAPSTGQQFTGGLVLVPHSAGYLDVNTGFRTVVAAVACLYSNPSTGAAFATTVVNYPEPGNVRIETYSSAPGSPTVDATVYWIALGSAS